MKFATGAFDSARLVSSISRSVFMNLSAISLAIFPLLQDLREELPQSLGGAESENVERVKPFFALWLCGSAAISHSFA
ncbi:MAG: hypothetical protein AB7U82_04670 [Blastocatellales bacterium]